MKYNPYTGMGASKYRITQIHQCISKVGSMSSSPSYLYFKVVGLTLELITEDEFNKFSSENEEALKKLKEA